MPSFLDSTSAAIDAEVLDKIKEKTFCIVGCGGVGSLFAEILVRTGAQNIHLVDADKVEERNLNKSFQRKDLGEEKVVALSDYLKNINEEACIKYNIWRLRKKIPTVDGKNQNQEVRDIIYNADITCIACDDFDARVECYKLCRDGKKDWLSIGLTIDKEKKSATYECLWKDTYKEENRPIIKGYGRDNGSYCSIVMEVSAVGFNLMLHHLQLNSPDKTSSVKRKYKNFIKE